MMQEGRLDLTGAQSIIENANRFGRLLEQRELDFVISKIGQARRIDSSGADQLFKDALGACKVQPSGAADAISSLMARHDSMYFKSAALDLLGELGKASPEVALRCVRSLYYVLSAPSASYIMDEASDAAFISALRVVQKLPLSGNNNAWAVSTLPELLPRYIPDVLEGCLNDQSRAYAHDEIRKAIAHCRGVPHLVNNDQTQAAQ